MKTTITTVNEPARATPVLAEVDVCVIGGSATGVFAAIRAARMGMKVAIVEKLNCFGGNATAGMVLAWHSLLDVDFKEPIIAGLTAETLRRLQRRNGLHTRDPNTLKARVHKVAVYIFNVEELKIELDEMVVEHGIKPYLHTLFAGPHIKDGSLRGVFVENKSGRGVILAKAFIDASGDGDLCVSLGAKTREEADKQPATTCAIVHGYTDIPGANDLLFKYREQYNIPNIGWEMPFPHTPKATFWAKSNMYLNLADADQLTAAEIDGRRQVRAMMDILRAHGENGKNLVLLNLGGTVGARETRQILCQHTLTGDELMRGVRFEDAIANGSYPSDIHHTDKLGATYQYLDGLEEYELHGRSVERSRWLPDGAPYSPYWQIPYRSLLPQLPPAHNVIVCGRALDADKRAFGAARVMVILNQTGEAAGVAAALSVAQGKSMAQVSAQELRKSLKAGGSIVL